MRYTWKYIVVIVVPTAGALSVAVPGICLRRRRSLAFADRGHSLGSLDPPPAAVASFPVALHLDIYNALII